MPSFEIEMFGNHHSNDSQLKTTVVDIIKPNDNHQPQSTFISLSLSLSLNYFNDIFINPLRSIKAPKKIITEQ